MSAQKMFQPPHKDYKIRDKISLMRIECETGFNWNTDEAKDEAVRAIDSLVADIKCMIEDNANFYKKVLDRP